MPGSRSTLVNSTKSVRRIMSAYITIPDAMTISRRRFLGWTSVAITVAGSTTSRARLAAAALDDRAPGFRPELLPTQKAVWDQQIWMAKLGPKYTGNKAHTTFVDFLASEFKTAGCEIV